MEEQASGLKEGREERVGGQENKWMGGEGWWVGG